MEAVKTSLQWLQANETDIRAFVAAKKAKTAAAPGSEAA